MKTPIDLSNTVFSQLANIKSTPSLTVLGFCRISQLSSILVKDHGFVREELFLFFLPRFTFVSLAGSFSSRPLPLPLSSQSSRSIINDIRVTQVREILNTVALLRRLRWEREAGEGPIVGPPRPHRIGKKKKKKKKTRRARASELKKKRPTLAGDGGVPPAVDEFIEEKLGGL